MQRNNVIIAGNNYFNFTAHAQTKNVVDASLSMSEPHYERAPNSYAPVMTTRQRNLCEPGNPNARPSLRCISICIFFEKTKDFKKHISECQFVSLIQFKVIANFARVNTELLVTYLSLQALRAAVSNRLIRTLPM